MKDALLGLGALLGIALTGFGLFCRFHAYDNPDAAAMGISFGYLLLVPGVPLLFLCAWGLAK